MYTFFGTVMYKWNLYVTSAANLFLAKNIMKNTIIVNINAMKIHPLVIFVIKFLVPEVHAIDTNKNVKTKIIINQIQQ